MTSQVLNALCNHSAIWSIERCLVAVVMGESCYNNALVKWCNVYYFVPLVLTGYSGSNYYCFVRHDVDTRRLYRAHNYTPG
jgi:hypothetical protein